tara:strand:- start:542 stop:865 length:324 start_codon:yes stop_codon:yes gene_type:complete
MGSGLNETMYGGTDGTKLTPKQAFEYKEAVAVAADTVSDRPLYVIINKDDASNAYSFKYETDGGYVDYGKVDGNGPVKVDIQPIAWNKTGAATGDVTFVYKRTSSGN